MKATGDYCLDLFFKRRPNTYPSQDKCVNRIEISIIVLSPNSNTLILHTMQFYGFP